MLRKLLFTLCIVLTSWSLAYAQVGRLQGVVVDKDTGEPIPFVPYRSLLTAVIFSFLTCGLYQLYWFIVMTDEISKISDDHNTTGIKAFLFSLLTCGIYTFYWYYKMGKNLYIAGQKYNKNLSDNSILYLVLGIFGFGIVSYCLMQSDLNKFSNQQ